jgi:hypothetical protein
MNLETIIEEILLASSNGEKALIINKYISSPVIKELKSRGYSISENRGVYTIKW